MSKPIASAKQLMTACLIAGLTPLLAHAQGRYPDKPIRMIVPFAPGGGTDIVGRRLSARLTATLGQNVVVDNKGGADGAIGSAEAARARPDGYTLNMCTSSSHTIMPLMEKLPYDPVKDFTHVAVIGITPMVIAVHPAVARTLPELIARVKESPGKYAYGSTGVGGIVYLAGELLKKQAGNLDMTNVSYKGSGQSVQDLIAGHIPSIIATFSTVEALHRSGRVRILAVFTEKRSNSAPDIPTAIEQGVPGVLAYTFNMLCGPANLPKPIVAQLHQATMKVMDEEAFLKELVSLAIEPVVDSTPEKAHQFMRDEITRWGAVVKESGVKAQ